MATTGGRRVHVNRERRVPTRFSGFRLEGSRTAYRGPARVAGDARRRTRAARSPSAVRHFWQNFPKALEGGRDRASTIGLFPQQWDDLHELQGGERKTHTVSIAFDSPFPRGAGRDARSGACCRVDPEWYAAVRGGAVADAGRRRARRRYYERLVNAAHRRRRHVRAQARTDRRVRLAELRRYLRRSRSGRQQGDRSRCVSHYNNQYDAVAGFAIQFMRSGDLRWFSAMEELAASRHRHRHLSHRWRQVGVQSRPVLAHRSLRRCRRDRRTAPTRARPGVSGGGPSNEHDYSTGLLLHHLLTGDQRSRDGVIELVDWVMAMDDGRRTVFRFLSRGDTGLASSTVSPDFHGPGRGAGNSIATLLNGFRLTGDRRLLAKAEALIRRCIHPADDIAAQDAARRRAPLVLHRVPAGARQIPGREGAARRDRPAVCATRAPAWCTTGDGWRRTNIPYLDKPDLLEYPERNLGRTGHPQGGDLRHRRRATAASDDRERMLERSRFFFAVAIAMLMNSDTRTPGAAGRDPAVERPQHRGAAEQ